MGAGLSQLTEDQVKQLRENTPFSDKDLAKLLKRYAVYDPSEKGTEGIEPKALLTMPELAIKPVIPRVLELFADPSNGRILPEQFLYMFAALSSKTPIESKRKLAWRCIDVHASNNLKHDEVFRMYKLFLTNTTTDDQILELMFQTLDHPVLETKGVITSTDFPKLVPDSEIALHFTVDLQLL